jgi:hypothetical protein
MLGVGIGAAVLVAGCATGGTTVAPPTATPPAVASVSADPPPTAATPAGVLPAALVGAWSSTGENTEIAYRFVADGRYRSIEILTQPRPGGVFEFRRQQDGTVRVSGDLLRLSPTTSVSSRTDPDDPGGDYTDRPSDAGARRYTWQVSGATLVLTDADGLAIRLARQS